MTRGDLALRLAPVLDVTPTQAIGLADLWFRRGSGCTSRFLSTGTVDCLAAKGLVTVERRPRQRLTRRVVTAARLTATLTPFAADACADAAAAVTAT